MTRRQHIVYCALGYGAALFFLGAAIVLVMSLSDSTDPQMTAIAALVLLLIAGIAAVIGLRMATANPEPKTD